MKIKKSTNRVKIISLVAIAAALLITALILEFRGTVDFLPGIGSPSTSGPTAKQEQTQRETAADQKREYIESTSKGQVIGSPAPIPTETSSIDLSASQSGTEVTVFTKLYGYAEGTCTLTVTKNTETITKEAPIIYQPEYSTCAGFSFNDELSPGEWTVRLTAIPSGGAEVEKTISLKVSS